MPDMDVAAGACFYAFDPASRELHVLMVHKVKQLKVKQLDTCSRSTSNKAAGQPADGKQASLGHGDTGIGHASHRGKHDAGGAANQGEQRWQQQPQQLQQCKRMPQRLDLASAMQALALAPPPNLVKEWNFPGECLAG